MRMFQWNVESRQARMFNIVLWESVVSRQIRRFATVNPTVNPTVNLVVFVEDPDAVERVSPNVGIWWRGVSQGGFFRALAR